MQDNDWDMAVCLVTAFQGVMRLDEPTENKDAFNPNHHITEADIQFIPNFRNPSLIILKVGRSKADQMGTRAILHPREFPVTPHILSAGARIKDLFCNRYNLTGTELTIHQHSDRPLFVTERNTPLKERHVLRYMRKSATSFGYSPENVSQLGTRSLRIGGSTALFKAGASSLDLMHMGGWSTDAHQAYIRSQAPDFHHLTIQMINQ